jgi:hypothetical protein
MHGDLCGIGRWTFRIGDREEEGAVVPAAVALPWEEGI